MEVHGRRRRVFKMSLSQMVDLNSHALKLSCLISGIPLVRAEAQMMLVTLWFQVICGRNLVARRVCHGTEVVGGTMNSGAVSS